MTVFLAGVLGAGLCAAPISEAEASRFLTQATLGPNLEMIRHVARTGPESWLESQFAAAPTLHTPRCLDIGVTVREEEAEVERFHSPQIWAWWDVNMSAEDQLRQRVAYALSQILVVSSVGSDLLEDLPWGLTGYYDILVEEAFGNYRDLLYRVSTNPAMGIYLSHARNRKPDPDANRFPDENYAREVMQLFTLGQYMLNQDGSRKLDAEGQPIPTYTNQDIRALARVFTGMTFDPQPNPGFPLQEEEHDEWVVDVASFLHVADHYVNRPMFFYEDEHDRGPKQLLTYTDLDGKRVSGRLPGRQSIAEDLDAAIDNLFHHPNVGPFVSYRLIQRLVTSNPSPEYISRVATIFHDNGEGVRGDMRSVVRAILLDPEARDPRQTYRQDPAYGKLREPYVRYIHLARALGLQTNSGLYRPEGWDIRNISGQQPMAAPSVFNFYQPDYGPVGAIRDQKLVAPEFQIATASSIVGMMNHLLYATSEDALLEFDRELPGFGSEESRIDREHLLDLSERPEALINHLALVLTRGALSNSTRRTIRSALNEASRERADSQEILTLAIYLFANSPDFVVLQ
ncbi:MAG: DUF1800 domain-containing protein [Verrucomicrobiota bacterium]